MEIPMLREDFELPISNMTSRNLKDCQYLAN